MKLNTWILDKILSYLANREGMIGHYSNNNAIEVTDVFGHRYEITIRLLSRNIANRQGLNEDFVPNIDVLDSPTTRTSRYKYG